MSPAIYVAVFACWKGTCVPVKKTDLDNWKVQICCLARLIICICVSVYKSKWFAMILQGEWSQKNGAKICALEQDRQVCWLWFQFMLSSAFKHFPLFFCMHRVIFERDKRTTCTSFEFCMFHEFFLCDVLLQKTINLWRLMRTYARKK